MSLRSTDVPAASGKRQHVWALTHSPACIPTTPLLRQQMHRRGHRGVSKHTSERRMSYAWPWFNGACGCVCSADWYLAWPTSAALRGIADEEVTWWCCESSSSWQSAVMSRGHWVGGRAGGSAGKGDVRVCVSMFSPGSRSDMWLACLLTIRVRGEDRGHPSSFGCNGRFKWPLASSWSLAVSLLPPAAAARCISQADHLIASPGARGGSSCDKPAFSAPPR